jgi:hypothetical protein
MGKSPTGNRPVPSVAGTGKNPSPSSPTYSGQRGTKSPTGSRPVPPVAKDSPRTPGVGRAVRRTPSHTSMPAPKRAYNTRGGGKPNGG